MLNKKELLIVVIAVIIFVVIINLIIINRICHDNAVTCVMTCFTFFILILLFLFLFIFSCSEDDYKDYTEDSDLSQTPCVQHMLTRKENNEDFPIRDNRSRKQRKSSIKLISF